MNDIPAKQNEPRPQWLLRARQQTYARATRWQLVQLAATVVAPTLFAIWAIIEPSVRAELAAASLCLVLVDIFVIDRAQLKLRRHAAKIAEQFDHEVLALRWNEFVAGAKLDPEDIHDAAAAYPTDAASLERIRSWYPEAVGRAPIHVARIACQLTNLRYDAALRNFYATAVLILPALVVLATLIAWASLELSFADLVLSLLAPATPIMVWALRERMRHKDTALAQETVKAAAEALWTNIRTCGEEECERRAREFQDAIFQRRVSSPLIFPLVYDLRRDKMEAQMNKGAEERLTDAGY